MHAIYVNYLKDYKDAFYKILESGYYEFHQNDGSLKKVWLKKWYCFNQEQYNLEKIINCQTKEELPLYKKKDLPQPTSFETFLSTIGIIFGLDKEPR